MIAPGARSLRQANGSIPFEIRMVTVASKLVFDFIVPDFVWDFVDFR